MEREIAELRRRLLIAEGGPSAAAALSQPVGSIAASSAIAPGIAPMTDPRGAANSLLELRRGGDYDHKVQLAEGTRVLGGTILYPEQSTKLFQEFFRFYHPFIPVLDPEKPADHYFELCPLLFWTVVLVAARRHEENAMLFTGLKGDYEKLVWSTIASVPQNYHVVKALAILCSWPLPTPSTSSDQTFLLSGTMRQIALQTGLHRPSHVQDFSRNKVDLREEDVQDRLKTWAVCNIVSQNVSTAYGQPSETIYDWTLTTLPQPGGKHSNPCDALYWSLQIERFVDKVSRKFYSNSSDPIGISSDQERATWISLLVEDYRQLEGQIELHGSAIELLYLRAAGLHLRLSAFFDSTTSLNYITDLLELYNATSVFLRAAFALQSDDSEHLSVLKYASRHIVMMILAGGFTLMKMLNSFFARHIDIPSSKMLFSNTIRGIRSISIANNDLPARLAEVLAQLWHSYGAGMRSNSGPVDSSLQLKVRSRMSMSLVFDAVWRWREEFQFKGDGTTAMLDAAVNHPTQPDVSSENNSSSGSGHNSANGSATISAVASSTNLAGYAGMLDPAHASIADASVPSAALNESFTDYNLFDPLAFMLDAPTEFGLMGEDWDVDMHMQLPYS